MVFVYVTRNGTNRLNKPQPGLRQAKLKRENVKMAKIMIAKRRDRTKKAEGEEKQEKEGGRMKWGMKALKEN